MRLTINLIRILHAPRNKGLMYSKDTQEREIIPGIKTRERYINNGWKQKNGIGEEDGAATTSPLTVSDLSG